jgi:hypothetical protein
LTVSPAGFASEVNLAIQIVKWLIFPALCFAWIALGAELGKDAMIGYGEDGLVAFAAFGAYRLVMSIFGNEDPPA